MKKFPSIDQFRQVVREVKSAHDYIGKDENGDAVYRHESPYPSIEFKGTIKIHGTNAGVVKYKDRIQFQSRERVLSLQQDNSGFMLAMLDKNLDCLFEDISFSDHIAVYGEWCGQGIQKGVAVSELPKMFVIFAVNVDGEWVDVKDSYDENQRLYSIQQFRNFEVDIDFNNPELSQNKLVELTNEVEKECPVGKHFGVSGIGEGVVWKAKWNDKFFRFKVKGEKHSVSRVKKLASVDTEMIESIKEFVECNVTESRIEQGVNWLKENGKELSQKSTGDFLRWIVNDIVKEETDTIVKNQLDVKKVNSAISNMARVEFFKYLDKEFVN